MQIGCIPQTLGTRRLIRAVPEQQSPTPGEAQRGQQSPAAGAGGWGQQSTEDDLACGGLGQSLRAIQEPMREKLRPGV